MNREIKETLKEKIEFWMNENSISWYMLQDKALLLKSKCPVSYGTLYKIVKDESYNTMTPNKQESLLKFFKVKHKRVFRTIELVKNGE